MNISVVVSAPQDASADVLVVWQDKKGSFGSFLKKLDKLSDGFFTKLQKSGDLPASGEPAVFTAVPNIPAKRVAVCAMDDDAKSLQAAGRALFSLFSSRGWEKCAIGFSDVKTPHAARLFFCAVGEAAYRFDAFKTQDEKSKKAAKHAAKIRYEWLLEKKNDAVSADAVWAQAWIQGVYLARDLGNTPPNVCTPDWLGRQAERLAKEYSAIRVNVLKRKEIEALGMHALLAVAQGSVQEPRLIEVEYRPAKPKNKKPIVLVGKGVTFDAGGISIKPAADMDLMKYDMGGAAAVLGAVKAAAAAALPLHIAALVPAVENLPDGGAMKPGDIVKSMSGKTIEVLNTDAEGRLILCDTLTYAARYQPQAVIDLATLTGAVVIALGSPRCGLFGNDENLQDALFAAGERAHDRAWKMPLDAEYVEMMKHSPFADLANISASREAGSVTAAAFLSEFAQDYTWAHLDIAGVAWNTGRQKGGSGRPVGLLLEYFKTLAG